MLSWRRSTTNIGSRSPRLRCSGLSWSSDRAFDSSSCKSCKIVLFKNGQLLLDVMRLSQKSAVDLSQKSAVSDTSDERVCRDSRRPRISLIRCSLDHDSYNAARERCQRRQVANSGICAECCRARDRSWRQEQQFEACFHSTSNSCCKTR